MEYFSDSTLWLRCVRQSLLLLFLISAMSMYIKWHAIGTVSLVLQFACDSLTVCVRIDVFVRACMHLHVYAVWGMCVNVTATAATYRIGGSAWLPTTIYCRSISVPSVGCHFLLALFRIRSHRSSLFSFHIVIVYSFFHWNGVSVVSGAVCGNGTYVCV